MLAVNHLMIWQLLHKQYLRAGVSIFTPVQQHLYLIYLEQFISDFVYNPNERFNISGARTVEK